MPIHDLFDRHIFGIFHKCLLCCDLESRNESKPEKRDKTPNRAQSKNDEVTLYFSLASFPLDISFLFCVALFCFISLFFRATKKRVFIHLFGLSSYSNSEKERPKNKSHSIENQQSALFLHHSSSVLGARTRLLAFIF